MSMLDNVPPRLALPFMGPALALAAFCVWAPFSVLPGLTATSGTFRIREARDTTPFWLFGVPFLVVAQAFAGALARDAIWKLPLWTVGGLFAGMLIVHKPGTDLGLLPLSIIFIGLPSYVALLGASAIGRVIERLLRRRD